jgi:small-conductance mechanosensitive channel
MDDLAQAFAVFQQALRAFGADLTSIWTPVQLGVILLAYVIGAGVSLAMRNRVDLAQLLTGWPPVIRQLVRSLAIHAGVVVFVLLLSIADAVMQQYLPPRRTYLVDIARNLATAWLAIALLAGVIHNRFVYRVVAISAWSIAALSIIGALEPTARALDSLSVTIGGLRVSLLLVLKANVLLSITLWLAALLSNFIERRLQGSTDLTPSIQVLLGKLVRLALITVAVLIVLSAVGIDLTALAFFSGAIGVGLGFGLQKIVSNLVSGIILLADKSIKPGDVITVGDTYGWVTTMGARYTSVDTRDGREYLIPNEDFVTQRVINWSYTDQLVRIDVPFGTTYGSDPHVVQRVAAAMAAGVARVLKNPQPVCHLVKFASTSIDFELRFWINDPVEGITNVRSAVLLALWDAFKREGIDIPKPGAQRVIVEQVKEA